MVQQGEIAHAVVEPPKSPQRKTQTKTTQSQPRKNVNWPLYPPPVIEVVDANGKSNNILNSNPNFFAYATLMPALDNTRQEIHEDELTGDRCSSLHHLPKEEKGYFIFGDIHVKHAGKYYLRFDMLEMIFDSASGSNGFVYRTSIESDTFEVLKRRADLPPAPEKLNEFTEEMLKQGVKLKCRRAPKDPKAKAKNTFESNLGQEAASNGIVQGPARKKQCLPPANTVLQQWAPAPTGIYHTQFWGAPQQYFPSQPQSQCQSQMQNVGGFQDGWVDTTGIAAHAAAAADFSMQQPEYSQYGYTPVAQPVYLERPLQSQNAQFQDHPGIIQSMDGAANTAKPPANPAAFWDPEFADLIDPGLRRYRYPPNPPDDDLDDDPDDEESAWGPG